MAGAAGNYRRAEDAYKELLDSHDVSGDVHLFLSCCYFFKQQYEDAEKAANKGPNSPLRSRLLFNIYHRMGNEEKLMACHANLKDRKDDQLSLAAVHYLRSHYQEVAQHSHQFIHWVYLIHHECYI